MVHASNGFISGKTQDFLDNIEPLLQYEAENKQQKELLGIQFFQQELVIDQGCYCHSAIYLCDKS